MSDEIHVDPSITDPVIKYNGECYEFGGPSEDNVDAQALDVYLNCDDCVTDDGLALARSGDGINQNFKLVGELVDPSQSYSWGAWVRATSWAGVLPILYQEDTILAISRCSPVIRVVNGIAQHLWSDSAGSTPAAVGNGALPINTYVLVSGSREDDNEINIRINGTLQTATVTAIGTSSTPEHGFAALSDSLENLYGDLDISGIVISKAGVAFSQADWTELYNGGKGMKASQLSGPLVAKIKNYYNGDGATATNEIDRIGSTDLVQFNGVTSIVGPA